MSSRRPCHAGTASVRFKMLSSFQTTLNVNSSVSRHGVSQCRASSVKNCEHGQAARLTTKCKADVQQTLVPSSHTAVVFASRKPAGFWILSYRRPLPDESTNAQNPASSNADSRTNIQHPQPQAQVVNLDELVRECLDLCWSPRKKTKQNTAATAAAATRRRRTTAPPHQHKLQHQHQQHQQTQQPQPQPQLTSADKKRNHNGGEMQHRQQL